MRHALRRPQGDDGVALFAAIAVTAITSALVLVILGYAVSAARDSGRDRGRAVAVASVEGVVDTTYAALQTSDPGNLPCAVSPAGVLGAGPDGATAQATVTYLKADGTSFTGAGGCLPAGYSPLDVAGAVIDVRGTTAAANGMPSSKRQMESYVKLTPVFAQKNSLGKAIYASGALGFSNNATLLGNVGSDADVYAGSVFNCSNSLALAGSLYVQGPVTFSNSCSVNGDVHALGSVTVHQQSTIGGRVISSGGGVALNHPQISVGGVIQAAGDITGQGTWGGCAQPKCQRFLAPPPPPPPADDFPILRWDADTQAARAAAGYSNVVSNSNCGDAGNGVNHATRWFVDNAAVLPAKTVLLTDCEIGLQGNAGKNLKLRDDLLIVARGGFTTANQTTFGSTVAGQTRHLHWVVPYDAAARPCSTPKIATDNQFDLTADVKMFLYSPCDIYFANRSTHIGQIYGGSNVWVSNKFTLQFRPVPVFGVKLPLSTTVVESYKVDIVFKRETV